MTNFTYLVCILFRDDETFLIVSTESDGQPSEHMLAFDSEEQTLVRIDLNTGQTISRYLLGRLSMWFIYCKNTQMLKMIGVRGQKIHVGLI